MLKRTIVAMLGLGLILGGWSSTRAEAQGFRWPDEPRNLRVLTVKGRELGSVMRDFAFALGVRCQYCHVGQEGKALDPMDLTTFDFASDGSPMKAKARTMIAMVDAINDDYLSKLGVATAERIEVRCVTCHHGVERPRLLGDLLEEELDQKGLEAAIDRYQALRKEYYGGFAYDFGPGSLAALGERLLGEEKLEEAIGILALENRENPDFAYGHYLSARALEKAGRLDEAIAHMEEAVSHAPDEQRAFFEKALRQMKNR